MTDKLNAAPIPEKRLILMRQFLAGVPQGTRQMNTDPSHPGKGTFYLREGDSRQVVAEVHGAEAAHLLANAPAWIEALLAENKQLKDQLQKG